MGIIRYMLTRTSVQMKMNHSSPLWFFPPGTPLEVTQGLVLHPPSPLSSHLTISAQILCTLSITGSQLHLLLAGRDRTCVSSLGSCSSQMLHWQAVIGWQIKENGSSWIDKWKDVNKPISALNQQVLVNLIGNVLQISTGKQGGHFHEIV